MPPIKQEISPRASEIFELIKALIAKNGYSPSYSELGKLTGISGPMVFRYIKELRKAKLVNVIGKRLQVGDEISYSPKLREIMEIIAKNPDATLTELSRLLHVAPPTMFEHLDKLKKLNALDNELKIIDAALLGYS
jgi:Mn-dependent DtxR family transcriptional regulator